MEWNADLDIYQMICEARDRTSTPFYMETTMVGCWSFWIHRMRANFENQNIS
jgi:hypothetical protein